MISTKGSPMTSQSTTVFQWDARQRNVQLITRSLRKVITKVGNRLPGVTFNIDTEPLAGPRTWCLSHREWGKRSDPREPIPCYTITEHCTVVTVTADGLPLWDGTWRVAGVLTADTEGTVTATDIAQHVDYRLVEGTDGIAGTHRHLAGQCAHCNRTIRRTTTVLLTDGTEIRPVGRNCLADYTGGTIRAELLPVLTSLGDRFAVASGVTNPGDTTAPVLDLVAIAVARIEHDSGYVARHAATSRVHATVDSVRAACTYGDGGTTQTIPSVTLKDVTPAHRATAVAAIVAILDTTDDDTFTANLRAAAGAEYASFAGKGATVGLLAYLPEWHRRDTERRVAREAAEAARADANASRTNAYIGALKERREFTGRVVSERHINTDYGMSTLLIVDTAEGTVKVFGTVPASLLGLDAGTEVTFTATIVGHTEYQGLRQTRVNRIKVTP